MSGAAGAVAWLRWLALALALLAWRTPPVAPARPLACGSALHAWWVARASERWSVMHAAPRPADGRWSMHAAASFEDEPVALAAEGDAVWVVFRGALDRSEVLTGEAARNPASGLMFIRPAGLRPCASLPETSVESVAAHQGTLWALAPAASAAWRLRGERWSQVALPEACASASPRALASTGADLWLVAGEGPALRWKWSDDGWQAVGMDVPAWSATIAGSPRLALELADGTVGTVQQGRFIAECVVPAGCAPIGSGDGFAALRVEGETVGIALASLGNRDIGPFLPVEMQRSSAARWFHLPVLGVLSLGALMAALLVRAASLVRGRVLAAVPAPMPVSRRALALALDALPTGCAAMLAFDAEPERLLLPPLWSTDLSESLPFVVMVVGTVAFGALEECVGGRSLGKRLFGGSVVSEAGQPAAAWRHALRNLLKGLVMLSPVLALPVLLGRRRQGLPEVITGTVVAEA